MNGDYLVEFFQRIFFYRNDRAIVAGVIHQDVHSAKYFSRGYDDLVRFGRLRQVCSYKRDLSSSAFDFFRGGGEFGFRASGEEDRRAFFGEELRHGAADATARSGDQRDFILQQAAQSGLCPCFKFQSAATSASISSQVL